MNAWASLHFHGQLHPSSSNLVDNQLRCFGIWESKLGHKNSNVRGFSHFSMAVFKVVIWATIIGKAVIPQLHLCRLEELCDPQFNRWEKFSNWVIRSGYACMQQKKKKQKDALKPRLLM